MYKHRFEREQQLTIVNDPVLGGQRVKVLALVDERCSAHNALCYGCELGGDHMMICEEQLTPLTHQQKRKMN